MTEIDRFLEGTHRRLTGSGDQRVLVLRRRYTAPIDDVWSACTEPDRLRRFFLPVSGDLGVGGKFQLEGNAGGEILRCEPPRLLAVTWVYGDEPPSQVELRLSPADADDTVLELQHFPIPRTVEMDGRQLDPVLNDDETGLWGMGTGWEMGLIFLDKYLRGEIGEDADPESPEESPEIAELVDRCGRAWAAVARGDATRAG